MIIEFSTFDKRIEGGFQDKDVLILAIDIANPPKVWATNFCKILDIIPDFRPSITVVTFFGYDDDPREVWEVPECCAWVRELVKYDPFCLRALADERQFGGSEWYGRAGLGRVQMLVIAGHGKHKWESGNREDGYMCHLSESGVALLSQMATQDKLELQALSNVRGRGIQA